MNGRLFAWLAALTICTFSSFTAPGATYQTNQALAARISGTWVLQQVSSEAELKRLLPALIAPALDTPQVRGLSLRVPWKTVDVSFSLLDAGLKAARDRHLAFSVRFMAGRHTPARVFDEAKSPFYLKDGEKVPAPFNPDGSPNAIFEAEYEKFVARLAAWCRQNDVPLLHLAWYGQDWAELNHGREVRALPGYSYQNWLNAHLRLLDIGLRQAGPDLAVEFPFSGHGPLTDAAVAFADHVVSQIGPWNPVFFCQANGWGPKGDWGAPNAETEAAFDRVWSRPICRGQQMIQPDDYDWAAVFPKLTENQATYGEIYAPSFTKARKASLAAEIVKFAALTEKPKAAAFRAEVKQITFGPEHHFFGYIGHVRNIPWNQGGRYIVALQTSFQERMPKPGEAADVILIDTQDNYRIRVVDQSRAWNFQQGTMFYWNPAAPGTQFFFNDRDPKTQEVFCVLFDISLGSNGNRIAEFRYADTPFGNSGVAQQGGWFCGINYGRLARLRPVTGYPGAADWTGTVKHPENDGIFKVNIATREKQLLVSFKQLADFLRPTHPDVDNKQLFINHTLCNRENDRIYFFVRGDGFETDPKDKKFNVACIMNADGSNLRTLGHFIGGHPEWGPGHTMIGQMGDDQILYDTDAMQVAGKLGAPEVFPKPGGDVALSPDGTWFVNGHGDKGKNYYTFLHRTDGAWFRSTGLDQGGFVSGDLRIDPGPLWNRNNAEILVPGTSDGGKTRQLFLITLGSP